MRKSRALPIATLMAGLVLGAGATQLVYGQQSGVSRTILQQQDIADLPGHVAVLGTVELPAGAAIGRHTHPGTEIGYVLDGTGTLMIDGEGPRPIKPGDSWVIPAGKPHDGKAGPDGPIKVLAVFVVEKGKPLASPVK